MQVSEFLKNLALLSTEDLLSIKGVGGVLAQNYKDFLESKRYQQLVSEFADLESEGFEMNIAKLVSIDKSSLPLGSQVICITGTFLISREQIKSLLEQKGAKVVDSVTSSTTILLAGEKSGSKLEKAKKLEIKIVQKIEDILE